MSKVKRSLARMSRISAHANFCLQIESAMLLRNDRQRSLPDALMPPNKEWLEDSQVVFLARYVYKSLRHEHLRLAEVTCRPKCGILVDGDGSLNKCQPKQRIGGIQHTPPGTTRPQIVSPPGGITRGTPITLGGPSRIPSLTQASKYVSLLVVATVMSSSLLNASRTSRTARLRASGVLRSPKRTAAMAVLVVSPIQKLAWSAEHEEEPTASENQHTHVDL